MAHQLGTTTTFTKAQLDEAVKQAEMDASARYKQATAAQVQKIEQLKAELKSLRDQMVYERNVSEDAQRQSKEQIESMRLEMDGLMSSTQLSELRHKQDERIHSLEAELTVLQARKRKDSIRIEELESDLTKTKAELNQVRLEQANVLTPETPQVPRFSFSRAATPVEQLSLGAASFRSPNGLYDGWNDTVEFITVDRWIALTTLLVSVQQWKFANFSVKVTRDEILKEISQFVYVKPCNRSSRFPDSVTLVNIDSGAIASLLQHINDALSFGERSIDQAAASSAKSYGSYNDAKVAFSRSIMRLGDMLRNSNADLRARYGIFNRSTFEAYYQLQWMS